MFGDVATEPDVFALLTSTTVQYDLEVLSAFLQLIRIIYLASCIYFSTGICRLDVALQLEVFLKDVFRIAYFSGGVLYRQSTNYDHADRCM